MMKILKNLKRAICNRLAETVVISLDEETFRKVIWNMRNSRIPMPGLVKCLREDNHSVEIVSWPESIQINGVILFNMEHYKNIYSQKVVWS